MSERTIFLEALDRSDVSERSAYLERACGSDAGLRERVEKLLTALEGAGGFMSTPAGELGSTRDLTNGGGDRPAPAWLEPNRIAEGPGTSIGPYKLLERIGEGGMGVVYMAEQERPIRRKVALKIIKPGMDSSQVIARFEAERQALALMEHPNIARVLDAGTTESGRPFFVMELVKGLPIVEYADRNRLKPRERLELFVPVCQAIQHAHQKGIIHRDIKPSNVLVTLCDARPVPKVIDFGVAKAIEQRLTEKTMFTQFGAVVGTLEYMSPEQASTGAVDVDARSDIYSLGVLLYELLAGSTPLERAKLRAAAYSDVLRKIRDDEPPKPSTRLGESKETLPSISAQRQTEPSRLAKLIRGDLDWIVMKALEKDRTRRYETAGSMACDLERHLSGDPVQAGPPSSAYRLRKLARKHRRALLSGGAFGLVLLMGAAISILTAVAAMRAQRMVQAEHLAAILARQSAMQAERAARDQAVESTNNAAGSLKVREPWKTIPQLERALAQRKRVLGADHADTLRAMDDLAHALFSAGRVELAESLLREALARRERNTPDDWVTFNTRGELGALLLRQKSFSEAAPLLESAYDGMKAHTGRGPADARDRLAETGARIVELYDAWGKKDKSNEWRKRLSASNKP